MQWAIAEWDYVATHEDELSFRKGDHILIQDSSHDEWWEGDCNGLSGVFPANRCQLLSALESNQDVALEEVTHDAHDQSSDQSYHSFDQTEYLDEQDTEVRPESYDTTISELQQTQHHGQHANQQPPSITSPRMEHRDTPQIQSPPPEPSDGLSDSEQVVLPPDWSATTNTKGQLYYYNVLTKETSWRLPSVTLATQSAGANAQAIDHEHDVYEGASENEYIEELSHSQDYVTEEEPLPEGWSSAQDEGGSQYFFNSSTGETTWDRPTSPEAQNDIFQHPVPLEPSTGPISDSDRINMAATSSTATVIIPQRQSSVEESMLQSQLLNLSLSDEELRALELSHLPPENIQHKGSLRVKSQKVSTNATISSWKDYWVVVYKGFLLFYRDEGGAIRSAYSIKPSSESMSRLKHATQVKPSGCFDSEKVAVEVPVNGQALTKKKNFFYITPGTNVRLLLQDASGGDVKAWVNDIKTSLASRKTDELSESEEPYLIQVLKRQTSGGGEAGLKMNKKIEEKDLKTYKNPLKMDKTRGIRSMVAQGIHVPRRKSAQDERLRLPPEEDRHYPPSTPSRQSPYQSDTAQQGQGGYPRHPTAQRPFATNQKRKTSRDQSKDQTSSQRKEQDTGFVPLADHSPAESIQDVGSPGSSSSHHGTKAKFSNMSRSFFSNKEKDKDKDKEREKEREKERLKEKNKERWSKDKSKEKDLKKEQGNPKAAQGGSIVFGGSLIVEPGRTVPKVVELCIKTIEARGLETAGVYRVSGHMASIQNLKRAFNDGSLDVERLIEKEPDINTIAALLKLYFRDLREPLMLFEFYPSFIAAADISDYNEKLYTIKSLVHSLPESNFNTLKYLMMHLGRVQDQYHTTKMDSANLAICFAPNLLRQEVDDLTSIINTGKQSSIIDTLIEQREWVFDPYPEEDEEVEGEQVEEAEPADQVEQVDQTETALVGEQSWEEDPGLDEYDHGNSYGEQVHLLQDEHLDDQSAHHEDAESNSVFTKQQLQHDNINPLDPS